MVNRLKNALWLIVGAVAAVWALTTLVGVVQGGPMEPPAAPGPTNRMAIYQPAPGGFPIVISQPGSYYLGENITGDASGKPGIKITVSNVTLDLNGFTLRGGLSSGVIVDAGSDTSNLFIHNGTVSGWGGDGIACMANCNYSELRDLIVNDNGGAGVSVLGSVVLTRVQSQNNGGDGIVVGYFARVSDSLSTRNGGDGIGGMYATLVVVTDSVVTMNDGNGIAMFWDAVVSGCEVASNYKDGIVVGGDSLLVGNNLHNNGSGGYANIHTTGSDNRIEGNNMSINGDLWNMKVDAGGNIIIKNSASGTNNYSIAAGNAFGMIVNVTAGGPIPDMPGLAEAWFNFSY